MYAALSEVLHRDGDNLFDIEKHKKKNYLLSYNLQIFGADSQCFLS